MRLKFFVDTHVYEERMIKWHKFGCSSFNEMGVMKSVKVRNIVDAIIDNNTIVEEQRLFAPRFFTMIIVS